MAAGTERSTRFVFVWTFFAEDKTGKNAAGSMSVYSSYNDCFFWPPGGAGKSSVTGMRLARKSQGFGKICVESFPK
jgi:hypothetical protein